MQTLKTKGGEYLVTATKKARGLHCPVCKGELLVEDAITPRGKPYHYACCRQNTKHWKTFIYGDIPANWKDARQCPVCKAVLIADQRHKKKDWEKQYWYVHCPNACMQGFSHAENLPVREHEAE